MAQFDYKKFLREGGIEKYLMEANFGNDIEDRYEYIRPLMSRLPDSARTEALIDGMEDGLREDDKFMFDYYFVEAMKLLGLESELMEPDDMMSEPDYEDYAPDSALGPNPSFVEEGESLINPEAEEIDAEDLDASADYFDSLAENDNVLDEIIKEGTWSLGGPKEIDSIIKGLQGIIKMADDAQTKRNAAGRGFVNALQNQLKSDGWFDRLYKIVGDDSFFDHYDAANTAAQVRDFDGVKNHLGDAIARAEELKAIIMKNSGIKEGKFQEGDLVYRKFDDKKAPMKVVGVRKMFASPLQAVSVVGTAGGDTLEYDESQLVRILSPEEKANVFVRENEVEGEVQTESIEKVLKASNDLEDALNSAGDELNDDQIDSITNMILDLRDKVKAELKARKK